MTRAAVAATGAAVLALAGCGGPASDIFAVQRTGSIPDARLLLVVADDGTVRCNGARKRDMGSDRLLEARELARELGKDAERGRRFPPGPGSVLRYRVRLEEGTLSFADTSRGLPSAELRLAAFTRDVARAVCRLPR
jgi:hypothetical protein